MRRMEVRLLLPGIADLDGLTRHGGVDRLAVAQIDGNVVAAEAHQEVSGFRFGEGRHMAPIVLNRATGHCTQRVLDGRDFPLRAELNSL